MRANTLLAAAAALVVTAGCIDFDAAENSFCNHTLLEKRIGICGAPRIDALAQTPSGELWLVGENKPSNGSGPLAFLARYDGFGALLQNMSFRTGASGYVDVTDVAASPTGNALVIGTFQGGAVRFTGEKSLSPVGLVDSFVAGIDTEGQAMQNTEHFGVSATCEYRPGHFQKARVTARTIAARVGQTVVGGTFFCGVKLGEAVVMSSVDASQMFLLGMDQNLGYRWHAATTGCELASADHVTFDAAGNVYVLVRAQGAGCSFGSLRPLASETVSAPFYVVARYPATPGSSPAEPDWAVVISPAVGATEGCLAVSDAGILTAATPWGYDIDGKANSSQLQVRQLTAADGAPTEEQTLFISADGIACRGMAIGAGGKTWLAADFNSPHLATSDKPSPWEIRPGPNAVAIELSPSLSVESLRRYQSPAGARAAGIVLAPSGDNASLVGSFDGRLDVDLTGEALDASETHWSSHIFVR